MSKVLRKYSNVRLRPGMHIYEDELGLIAKIKLILTTKN